ncbi:hypothetical protein AB0D38_24825 [Streptomyces sp. NPDC048279]|uniref:hypothetical protein n=1 Tax=Streptomyces sp. NPDC048279 TaxID=3154714 RepID=UPI0034451960
MPAGKPHGVIQLVLRHRDGVGVFGLPGGRQSSPGRPHPRQQRLNDCSHPDLHAVIICESEQLTN